MSASCLFLLLLLAQQTSCRTVPGSSAQHADALASRRLLATPQTDAGQPEQPSGLGDVIEGQHIVMFTSEAAADLNAAVRKLQKHVQEAAAASAPGGISIASASADASFDILSTLSPSTAAARGAAGTLSTASARPGSAGLSGLVVRASANTAKLMKTASITAAVFPDRIITSQQLPGQISSAVASQPGATAPFSVGSRAVCVDAASLADGITVAPAASFKWTHCLTSSTKMVWQGEPCGDGSKIKYTRLTAVQTASNTVASTRGKACVQLPDPTQPAVTRQNFGQCGKAPTKAPKLPTRICAQTGGQIPASQPLVSSPDPAILEPVPSPDVPNPSVPVPSPEVPSPSPEVPQSSPTPDAQRNLITGPVMNRIAVAPGEQVPGGVARIEAVEASTAVDTAGLPVEQQVVVGVVDSGVDGTHPDIYYTGGQSWVQGDTSPDIDQYGHGTHVAGTIGARNSGSNPGTLSIVGVSPGVPIYSLKVLDGTGRGSLSSVLSAIKWAATEGVKRRIFVLNLSLAAYVPPTSADYEATKEAVCAAFKEASDAGILVTAAAGNYGASIFGYLPAACEDVVAVTALDGAGTGPASFSNWLPDTASDADKASVIAAPGTDILSTISYARDASGYRQLSGTSMASPHVAGVAANCMMSGACPAGSSGRTVLSALQAAAKERVSFNDAKSYGFDGDATSTANGKYYGLLTWAKF